VRNENLYGWPFPAFFRATQEILLPGRLKSSLVKLVTTYLSLGSNVGDRERNLRTAIAALSDAGVRVTRVSPFYETEPVDYLRQAWFLNCVVQGDTQQAPLPLLHELRALETRRGSKKAFAKGPRLIDIDILLYGNEVVDTAELQVPHPRMALRRFVLVPLAEIAPDFRHPLWRGTVADLLAETPDRSQVLPHAEKTNQDPDHES
jgi:2-amino-4-hydroxy-6-hydroxymethyldihydropteridine diphosphokinase